MYFPGLVQAAAQLPFIVIYQLKTERHGFLAPVHPDPSAGKVQGHLDPVHEMDMEGELTTVMRSIGIDGAPPVVQEGARSASVLKGQGGVTMRRSACDYALREVAPEVLLLLGQKLRLA
jgi:hypothetical protein